MASSRWQKHNKTIVYAGLTITYAIVTAVFIFFALSLGLSGKNWWSLLILFSLALLGHQLTFVIKNHYANSIARIFPSEPEIAELTIRTVLKNKGVRFSVRIEADMYVLKFLSPDLFLTIQPYLTADLENRELLATIVTLSGLNAKNKALTAVITEAIDEMAHQQAHNKGAKQKQASAMRIKK